MVIVDLTDTHGLVCDMVLSNRGPPYPYYRPYIYNTILNAFLCDQQSSWPPLNTRTFTVDKGPTFACKNPDACPRLQVYTDPPPTQAHCHTQTQTCTLAHRHTHTDTHTHTHTHIYAMHKYKHGICYWLKSVDVCLKLHQNGNENNHILFWSLTV